MSSLVIHKDGTVEVELSTVTDGKLQVNDLFIKYLSKSNIIVIGYDTEPASIEYTFYAINKGEPVSCKCKVDMGFRLSVFDIKNMELG